MVKRPVFSIYYSKYLAFLCLVGVAVLLSCNEPEEFSIIPEIEFNDIVFKNVDSGPDSLILLIDFKDGDGDLGLETSTSSDQFLSADVFFPYHDLEAIIDARGQFVTFRSESASFPWLRAFPNSTGTALYGDSDDRPDFSCINYEKGWLNPERTFFTSDDRIFDEDNQSQIKFYTSLTGSVNIDTDLLVEDTVFVRKNENRFNILVDYFVKRNGEYQIFDWLTAFDETACLGTDYNGRFPIFDFDNLRDGSSLEGTIKYSMLSSGFNISFRNDTIKLRISIKDRALHDSNVIETPDFTLQSIVSD